MKNCYTVIVNGMAVFLYTEYIVRRENEYEETRG